MRTKLQNLLKKIEEVFEKKLPIFPAKLHGNYSFLKI